MDYALPRDILVEIIAYLPIESLVFCSRTCRQMHAIVMNQTTYIEYRTIPPRKRESIIAEAGAQHQKQYLLEYFLPRCLPSYHAICLFAGEHCTVEECQSLLSKYLFVRRPLEHALAKHGRKKDLLALYGEISYFAVEGFVKGQQYDLLTEYMHKYNREDLCLYTAENPLLSLEWLSQYYASGPLVSLCNGCITVGIDPSIEDIKSAHEMRRYLAEAATTKRNDLFVKLLNSCADRTEWMLDIMHVLNDCVRTANEPCLTAFELAFKQQPFYRSFLTHAYAEVLGDIDMVEECIRKFIDTCEGTKTGAAGAAHGGHTECLLHFLEKVDLSKDHVILSVSVHEASRYGHFATLCALQKRYGHLMTERDYCTIIFRYKHDHEWLVDWCIECAGKQPLRNYVASVEFFDTFVTGNLPFRMHTIGKLLETGLFTYMYIYDKLAHIQEEPCFLQLFVQAYGHIYDE